MGRVLAIAFGALAAFWLASVHLLPVPVGVWLGPLGALVCAAQWRKAKSKRAVRERKRALITSDVVFLLAFGAFLWVRMRHPSINDLEKPMDLALLAQSARAQWLPFENPWFAGVPFTNYYFFGPFMGGVLARLLTTPVPLAYNLVQPLFCALFLSALWSLGAALAKSNALGVGVMALVGLGGHLEPLRQLFVDKTPVGALDWWKTSRVIPNTINEYPAFTMLIGDAHAHFYALSLAVAHFITCFGTLRAETKRQKDALLVLGGALLGVIALTNTWDAPFYGVLWLLCVSFARQKQAQWQAPLAGLALAAVVVLPFLTRFRSQVGGGGLELWVPNPFSFALFWGVWVGLGVAAFGLLRAKPSVESEFRRLLLLIGLAALLLPSIYYLGGVFAGGDLKHQDTVFKFYLQAWLLGGTGISAEFLARFRATLGARPTRTTPEWVGVWVLGGALFLTLFGVLSLAPYAVWKTRTQGYGEEGLSLDGAKWLPQSDHRAIEWLREQNGVVAEALPPDKGGDYDAGRGTLATQSGLPSVLCWPGHVRAWGFQNEATRVAAEAARASGRDSKQAQTDSVGAQVDTRASDLAAIFGPDAGARRAATERLGVSFVVVRPNEAPIEDAAFQTHEFDGDDGSKTFVFERKGF